MINTEKLNRIHGIDYREFCGDDGNLEQMAVLRLEVRGHHPGRHGLQR